MLMISRFRSSHRRCSIKIGVLKNFAKFTGKHLCQSLFFNKVAGLRRILRILRNSVNFAKFLRTPFLQKTSGRLFLALFYILFRNFLTIFDEGSWSMISSTWARDFIYLGSDLEIAHCLFSNLLYQSLTA